MIAQSRFFKADRDEGSFGNIGCIFTILLKSFFNIIYGRLRPVGRPVFPERGGRLLILALNASSLIPGRLIRTL